MQIQQSWAHPKQPIWVHKNQQFLKAVIKQISKDNITCTLESGDILRLKRSQIFHRNPLPIPPTRTDLMENDIINEPEILAHLETRFKSNRIYTYVENTLIAVNPYSMIQELYTPECKDSYVDSIILGKMGLKDQEPHIYSITAYMVKKLFEDRCSQAVIISGQSGAGKTQVNKQCLRFLSHYFSRNKNIHSSENQNQNQNNNIERAIMLSNPILQAFGNSKTIRNNNSSRFGKFLSIMIDSNTRQIRHAEIYNYLLEKSRIISRSKEEQNFHIFYQFLQKTTTPQKEAYHLLHPQTKAQLSYNSFSYLYNDQMKQYISNPDISLQRIRQSLTILPDGKSFDYLCRILSAVLHLGNLETYQDDRLDYCQIGTQQGFGVVCGLLMVDRKFLFEALTSYSIRIGGEDVVKWFSKREVQELIHSLSKTLYQRLFEWIITQLNSCTRSKSGSETKLLSLGFLDIYGFQVLKTNSLQQLFINYTNQRLHQLYLQKIFKLQKQYFTRQGLQQKFKQVNFQDNIKVIQLLDYQKLSIFNLLDQQCAIASPDQTTYITKIRFNHKKHQKFPPSNLNLLSTLFVIRHTPQDVQYSVIGFRDKNRDLLRDQIKITMRSSKLRILREMFGESKAEMEPMDAKSHRVRKFLSSKFRKQMNQLISDLLSKSEQMFIRCIKSNSTKKPLQIQQEMVYSQIKYLGILDTIKIKKMGYCIKNKYEDLDKRFYLLLRTKSIITPATNQQIMEAIKKFLPKFGEEEILYGKSLVFWKDYAFSVFMQRYGFYALLCSSSAHKITNFFVKNMYLTRKKRKNASKLAVLKYMHGFLQAKKMHKKLTNVRKVQKQILNYLSLRNRVKKQQSIQIIQVYIKRSIQSKIRTKRQTLLQKVILRLKSLLFLKKIRSKLIAKQILKQILSSTEAQVYKKNTQTISKYIHSLKIKIMKRQYINVAFRNQRNAIEGRSLNNIQIYLCAFSNLLGFVRRKMQVTRLQAAVRGFLGRVRRMHTVQDVMKVQRAIREYLFLKRGAKDLFQSAYTSYQKTLKSQSQYTTQKLHNSCSSPSPSAQPPEISYQIQKFLTKFKQKISLLYLIIDFESFIDLEIIYPNNSWILNYCQLFQEGLEKNDPIQYISVGETFTIAATTAKMYLWGMHQGFPQKELEVICAVKTKVPVEAFQIVKNKLSYTYVKDDDQKKSDNKAFKICSTMTRDFNIDNGKLYECLPNDLRLFKQIPASERVLEISCGKSHTILRTSAKKVYTFGIGRQGQLGHSTFNSEDKPRAIKFFQNIKTSSVVQVAASFTSSLVLLSNRKLYWFGKNGTLNQISTPTLLQLKSKLQILNNNQFSIARILPTWSRTMSITGITILCYNNHFQNNLALRNKTTDILISKWQEVGITNINPPLIPAVSDHLEQCHVKIKKKKINIYPESKAVLRDMQDKVKMIGGGGGENGGLRSFGSQFSFAHSNRNQFQR